MRSLYESILSSNNASFADGIKQHLIDNCGAVDVIAEVEGDKLFLCLQYGSAFFKTRDFCKGSGVEYLNDIMKKFNIYYILRKYGYSYDGNNALQIFVQTPTSTEDLDNLTIMFDNPKWHWCDENHNELKGKQYIDIHWDPFNGAPSGDYKKLSKWTKTNSAIPFEVNGHNGTGDKGTHVFTNIDGDFKYDGYDGEATYILKNCKIGKLYIGDCNATRGPIYSEGTKVDRIVIETNESSYSMPSHFACLFKDIDVEQYRSRGYNSHAGLWIVEEILEKEFETVKKNIASWGNPEIEVYIVRNKANKHILKEWRGKYILKKV